MRDSTPGKVVLVTGASQGLGRALALAYARAGAHVALCARGEAALAQAAEEVEGAGTRWASFPADITRPDDVRRVIRGTVERFDRLDVVVNNASILGPRIPLEEYPPEEFARVLEVNTYGAFLVIREAVPIMRRQGEGSIINVSSGVGNEARARWGAYCASKFGLEALTGILAAELEGTGVRVNTVDPGRMRTAMRAAAYPEEDPKTLPDPAKVSPVFLYLASDRSRGVSGRRFRAQEFQA